MGHEVGIYNYMYFDLSKRIVEACTGKHKHKPPITVDEA